MAPHPLKSFIATLNCSWLKKIGEKGIVLPMVLTYILVFTAEITGLAEYASHTQRLVQSQINQLNAFYLADAACEKAVSAIRLYITKNGVVPPDDTTLHNITAAPNITSSGVTYSLASGNTTNYSGSGWTSKVLTAGDYAGLNGSTRTLNVSVTATDNKNGVTHQAIVNQTLEVQQIPIFQFGVFYQNDLEILPGANMTFSGPVHTNGNLYVATGGSTNSLTFDSSITATGTMLHERKDGSATTNGDVLIKDGAGAYQNMKNGNGSWLDSNSTNPAWATEAINRWNGNVQSGAQGVKTLTIPLPNSTNPQEAHKLIERRASGESSQLQAQKMDYKAQLRLIASAGDSQIQVLDKNGSAVELRYCSGGGTFTGSCPNGQSVINPISTASFKNFRENKTINSTDINVGLLNNSPAFNNLVNANNGVILYFSDQRDQSSSTLQDSVRLVNGASLPTKGLTVASENPMYVKGDFNTVSKQPSGLVADAFNILSNAWNDANSTNTNLTNKVASATTVNTTVVTGNTETTSGNYNGGFENIHRLHENWSSKNLTFSGSVIVLYNSQTATGNWVYGGSYYTAPNRIWSYYTALSSPSYSIPGFPSVYNVAKAGYEAT